MGKKQQNITPKGILSNWIVRNLLLGAAFVLAMVLLINTALKLCTRHGKELVVPDFTGMTYAEAQEVAREAGLRVVESDSIYIRKLRKGAVYNQTPKAGERVKEGRRIMLTTNSRTPKKVAMPALVGLSMRQAKAELESRGLVLGRLIYVNDIATNLVIKQQYRGRDIKAGTAIAGGSTVNLVLGLSSTDPSAYIPNLKGRKYLRAIETIQDNSLNVGKVTFDKTVKTYNDTINAVVWKQSPKADGSSRTKGTEVSISLTLDPEHAK